MSDIWLLIDRTLLEKALAALDAGLKLSPQSEFHDRLRAALEQKGQKEQDARAEQIMSEIWAQPDQTYEYIGAKLAENMQKAMKNRARVSIEAVRSALEQEEQEPVAIKDDDGLTLKAGWDDLPVGTPLYTTPPRREWRGLTEGEIKALLPGAVRVPPGWRETVAALEQALREKNT